MDVFSSAASPPLEAQIHGQFDLEDPRLRLLLCGYARLPPGAWAHTRVSLPYWRLYWNQVEGATIEQGTQTYALTPAEAVLIAPHTVFSTTNRAPIEHVYAHFQLPTVHVGRPPPLSFLPATPALRELAQRLAEALTRPPVSAWKVSLTARALVELALVLLGETRPTPSRLDARLLQALAFLEEHLANATSNADLARQAGLSTGALNQLFKAQLGQTLHAHLRAKRIEKACLMLEFSDASIDQIAAETGFCDRYYFSRVFKRSQQLSPAAFRRLHRNPFAGKWKVESGKQCRCAAS